MYYLLTASFRHTETQLTTTINEVVKSEAIYLLGSTLHQQRTESIFLTDAPSIQKPAHYFILVLISSNNGRSNNDLQDRIENTCRHLVPTTAIVFTTTQFQNWLAQGHPFVTKVLATAVQLQGEKINSYRPQQTGEIEEKEESAYTPNKVQEFLIGAEMYIQRNQNSMAIFMLHQAAEQALQYLLVKGTGLHINTHNLDKLIRYGHMVTHRLNEFFPRTTDADQRLFQLLQQAYIDCRYSSTFKPNKEDVEILLQRLKHLPAIYGGKAIAAGTAQ